ncbi:hypothetical protein [Aureibaculum luteum]|uniref:hypothetical protein n=1 Tax=Aureibaculum luteum TaxID=1548456 RepID=UPI000E5294FC|nr:hypothetical protein [Aureibaculum luteum]
MKTNLFLYFFIGITTFSLAQDLSNSSNVSNTKIYTVITEKNDTMYVIGPKKSSLNSIHRGFDIYDRKGQQTGRMMIPINNKYIYYKDEYGNSIKLKSVPLEKKIKGVLFKSPFMFTLIENTKQDLKKGKVDFYYLRYTRQPMQETDISIENSTGRNPYKSTSLPKINYYFKDSNGLHQIDSKRQFKLYPEILGKEVFKKMKQSNKNRKQFLLDYFTEYNKKIDNSIKQ